MKRLAWILIVAMVWATAFTLPINVGAQTSGNGERNWEDVIIDITTGTGPTIPQRLRPGRTRAINTNMARALNEKEDVRRLSAVKYGSPRWNKGVWLEYPKGNLGIIPMGSSESKPGIFPRREEHHALFLLKKGSRGAGTLDPCVLVVTASTTQSSASASVRRSLSFSNANGDMFLTGNLSGNKWNFKRVGTKNQFASRNCPQAFQDPDGGVGDCILETDVPEIAETPCEMFWLSCTAILVGNCIVENW